MTVGEKIRALRARLADLPAGADCESFDAQPLYSLGHAFFPASLGVYDPQRASISTIVLGSDWGNAQSFKGYLKRRRPEEHKYNRTVAGTDALLDEAGFDRNDCFYSNAWPAMRAGTAKEQNHHVMRCDAEFTVACRGYFKETLKAVAPKLVISLGNACAWFLAPFCGQTCLLNEVKSPKQVKIKDLTGDFFVEDGVVFVNATHPAHLEANRKLRVSYLPRYGGSETQLLVAARRKAGIANALGWLGLQK